ncbi:MAG: hypothetical protein GVY18_06315 [Bacteroidetes bacterium]|jgi:hypothetical protein|nr:hypothetical protein [Bacteroidota bacterium]
MLEYIDELLTQYRGKGLLLDTNVLLLLLVGGYDAHLISRFKRTSMFGKADFDLLVTVVDYFDTLVTTPHILTEVSNLSGQLPEHVRPSVFALLTSLIDAFLEVHRPAGQLAQRPLFADLGLTDVGIMAVAPNRYLVLTEDFRLDGYLRSQDADVLNFNHLRTLTG